jgi:hypothetical protein
VEIGDVVKLNPQQMARAVKWYPPVDILALVSREDLEAKYFSVLSLLVERATWRDKLNARRHDNHWLNDAKRDLARAGLLR